MNVEEKLTEVANYFKQKVLDGDYKFIKCDEYKATVLIDEKFNMSLWIANDPKIHFRFDFCDPFINSIEAFSYSNTKDRLKAYKLLRPHIEEYNGKRLIKVKEQQIEKLKNELEQLNSKNN